MTEMVVKLPGRAELEEVRRSLGLSNEAETTRVLEEIYRNGARDEVLARAVVDGKIGDRSVAGYAADWDGDPERTRALVARLEPVTLLARGGSR